MLKSKIEAILFLTDKPMRAQAIARIVNEDVQVVRQAILDLIHDYEERASGLEIADDNGYIIQVKDEYASIIDEFVPMEMPVSLIRTLSAIAIKQPVAQSEIIKIRGAGAYDHIKELMSRELIIKKEEGRSPTLSTTKKFQEYFRLSHDAKSLRTQLRKEEKELTKEAVPGDEDQTGGEAPNIHPEAIESSQAKQLEVLFDTSPDASLVFRPEELDGSIAPAGADGDGDITVMMDDIGADGATGTADDIPSINVSVSPDLSNNTEGAAVSRAKFDAKLDGTGSSELTDKNPEPDSTDE
ncbi:MAG: SMC-Scp complex subunit ScpB [Cyanobacteria bacterium SZAS LIN-5]|nr:SMC-Scp complex subunit ScpB [Cyanobacteria bacterium SZAS LIN-5]